MRTRVRGAEHPPRRPTQRARRNNGRGRCGKSDAAIPSPAPKKTRTALTDFIRRGQHSEARVHINREWHHSQVVRQRSAKPSFSSSSLDGASKNKGGIRRMPPLSFLKRKQNRQAGMAELADAERDVPGACAEHTRKSRTLKIHKNAGMAELADAERDVPGACAEHTRKSETNTQTS